MQRSGLNLRVLCRNAGESDEDGRMLSRRDMLGITGATAIGVSPALKALSSTLAGQFQVTHDRRRVSFKLAGKERWVIDTRHYSGSPVLKVEQTEHAVSVQLSGARYPGTSLPADLVCRIVPGMTGWRMNLRLSLGRFSASVPFERWLMGDVAARSGVTLRPVSVHLGDHVGLSLGGRARAEFRPDGTLRLLGTKLAELHGVGTGVVSDSVTLSVREPGSPSILSRPLARRTGILMDRSDHEWTWSISQYVGPGWRLTSRGAVFDWAEVEIGETRMGSRRAGVLAGTIGDDTGLDFKLDTPGAEKATEPLRLPLIRPRFAVALESSGTETALTAGYGGPVWLHVAGCGLQVGGHVSDEPFLLQQRDGNDSLRCAPALFSLATPLAGAVIEPSAVAAGQRVAIVSDLRDTAHVEHPANRARIVIQSNGRLHPRVVVANPTVTVVRPHDLLVLTFGFRNLDLNSASGVAPTLTVHDSTSVGFLGVQFPTQHFAEEVSAQASPPFAAGSVGVPARSWAARPSQLVFVVPGSTPALPFTLHSLLDWNRWSLNTTNVAVPPGFTPLRNSDDFPYFDPPGQPGSTETALSLPYRVVMSPPNALANGALPAFTHSADEVTHDGRTELWHTRYAVKLTTDGSIQELPNDSRLTLRAVWSPDFPTPATDTSQDPAYVPSPTIETAYDVPGFTAGQNRGDLVRLTSDFSVYDLSENAPDNQFIPTPLSTNRLMLTALGAWLDMQGSWNYTPISLSEWRNKTTMGRDHYVKIVRRGHLFPYGHQAAQVTVTEREIVQIGSSAGAPRVAYLIQRTFIQLLEHEKTYTPADFPAGWDTQQAHAREMPFKRVRITTEVTPPTTQVDVPITGQSANSAYWVDVNGSHFPFHVVAEDMEGKTVEFGAAAIFVQDKPNVPTDVAAMTQVATAYAADPGSTSSMSGQEVLFAEKSPLSSLAKDQNLEAVAIKMAGKIPPVAVALPDTHPRFYPALDSATVHIPAVKQLVGQDNDTQIKLNPTYLTHGLDPAQNVGQVFADLPTVLPMTYGGNPQAPMSPGVITPNLAISALSATAGPIGGSAGNFISGTFDPKDFFGALLGKNAPTILGSIKLSDILSLAQGVGDAGALASKVPQLVRQTLPNEIDTTLTWTADVVADPTGTFKPAPGTQLKIVGVSKVFTNGAAPSFEITGTLGPFTLSLLSAAPVIKIPFNSFVFHVKAGQKMEVTPSLGAVTFLPPLDFIQTLEGYLSSLLGGGTYIDIAPTYVTAGFKILIPSVGTGVFDIMNIALSAAVTIPFTGDPVRLRFDFSTKEHPFTVAILLIGGGGFFSLALGADGIESMDAALEVGGVFAIDLVIASGEIHAMMGIYFHWDKADLSLTGYIRLGGEVSVMGLISVGIEFELGLTYDFTKGDLYGRAELTLEVSIAFFSTSFSASIEKRIPSPGGSSSALRERSTEKLTHNRPHIAVAPPTLSDALTQADWTAYCGAFA